MKRSPAFLVGCVLLLCQGNFICTSAQSDGALWADNVFLFASGVDEFRTMVAEITIQVYRHKLTWKQSSLEYLCAGGIEPPGENSIEVETSVHEVDLVVMCRVTEIEVLGVADVRTCSRQG